MVAKARRKQFKNAETCLVELPDLPLTADAIADDIRRHFQHTLGRNRFCRSVYYSYESLALALRDRIAERWNASRDACTTNDCRRAYYLSMEFLMGRAMGNAMLNLGAVGQTHEALDRLGIDLNELENAEHDAGLGNGGLGRLAACFMDSCATLNLPVRGYGIRYRYGMFRQHLENGYQVEEPDHWLRDGNIWEMERPEHTRRIQFGGRTEFFKDEDGRLRARWVDTQDVLAIPFDVPIPGFENHTVLTLRLWSAAATDEFDLTEFNQGDYAEAVAAKNDAEHISMVLYPNDSSENGKELRLRQQYFLASASLQDVLEHWTNIHGNDFSGFADKNVFQLNDTHPSCSVPELMRLLLDVYHLSWDQAWEITSSTMAYTNHTLLPEALEKWPVSMFGRLLPRLLDIIYEINYRFLREVGNRWPDDLYRLSNMSIIEEGPEPQIRMAYLAIVGSFSVNGVAELHSELLKKGLFKDFYELWPKRFNNKTNGVTPRRWLAHCNPALRQLISSRIGDDWVTDLEKLSGLREHVDDASFREQWHQVKQENKARLARFVEKKTGVIFDENALFDVQVKRIHEYKRQLLNVLHVIHLFNRIKAGDIDNWTPRCVLVGGKAAPGYYMAKLIIKLTNNVAEVINNDPEVGSLLKLVFFPNYKVSVMEDICPGTDLSEQISTAGKEASGTGNMKFMMNGALTIGTLDGANIEIRDAVGTDNFFLFGMDADQVAAARGNYNPAALIAEDAALSAVIERLQSGYFNHNEPTIFNDIINALCSPRDPWMTLADFRSYIDAQQQVSDAYQDRDHWTRMSILNTAASGWFSTDRTITDYNRDIWKLTPIQSQ